MVFFRGFFFGFWVFEWRESFEGKGKKKRDVEKGILMMKIEMLSVKCVDKEM